MKKSLLNIVKKQEIIWNNVIYGQKATQLWSSPLTQPKAIRRADAQVPPTWWVALRPAPAAVVGVDMQRLSPVWPRTRPKQMMAKIPHVIGVEKDFMAGN